MAKVADLLPLPERVNIGKGDLELNGIPLDRLVRLLSVYQREIGQLVDEYRTGGNKVPYERVLFLFPEMVASIIAVASDSDGEEEHIRKISGPAQVECLMKIWKLTVPEPKKLKSLLSEVMDQLPKGFQEEMKKAIDQTKAQSTQ